MNSGKPESSSESAEDSRDKWIAIDRLCDAYEAGLQEGDVQRAPFLAGVPQDWRKQLTNELDAIDAAYRDARETHEQTLKVPANESAGRRLPTKGRLAELATLDSNKVWLGRFEIRQRLGTGATGSVWCARDARLARWVALKVPHATRIMSETTAARFQTEARAAAAITHPNVVQVHEVLIEDGLPILIQQWIDGPSLAKFVKDHGPMSFDQAADWMAQIADAVSCAHDLGIVHRDLKPANIMLNKNRPMVLDFGLASYPEFSSGLTTQGTVLGTPAYMSPEQAEGTESANQPATDIYALGTILYEMLVGTPPFVGNAREVLQANKTAIPTPPRNRRASIPRDLETIALRCLAKSPSARYRSAADLRDDLNRFRRREPIRARKVSIAENAWAWCRLHPTYALLAMGAPLVAALLMGMLISQLRQKQLSDRANRLTRQSQRDQWERFELVKQRQMVELSRASHELSEGDRTRGLQLLRSIPESARDWEWRLLNLMSHSPARMLNASVKDAKQQSLDSTSPQTSLALSKKHGLLFSAARDGTILKWAIPADRELFNKDKKAQARLPQPTVLYKSARPIRSLTVSPDGQWLCWVQRSGGVIVWDLNENELAQRISRQKNLLSHTLAFSPDSKQLAIGGGSVATADSLTDQQSWLLTLRCDDSNQFLIANSQHWTERSAVTSLAFTDNETLIMTRGQSRVSLEPIGYVERWRCTPQSLDHVSTIWRGLSMRGLDFHAKSNRIAWCDDGGMAYVKNLDDPPAIPPRQFLASRRRASQVRFGPRGHELVVTANDGGVSRWSIPIAIQSDNNASTAKPVANGPLPIRHRRDYHGHENTVRDAIFLSPRRNLNAKLKPRDQYLRSYVPYLITCGEDGRVLRWSNQDHPEIATLPVSDRPLIDATWVSPQQISVATIASKRQSPLYFKKFSIPSHELSVDMRRTRYVRSIVKISPALSPDTNEFDLTISDPARYAVCSRRKIFVFEAGKREFVANRAFEPNVRGGYTAACLVDSRYLIAATQRFISVSAKTAKPNEETTPVPRAISLLLYDLGSDAPPQSLDIPDASLIPHLRLSPDGTHVYGCSSDGTMFYVLLPGNHAEEVSWSDSIIQSWRAHRRPIRDFVWISGKQQLATVSDDGTCVFWQLTHQVGEEPQPLTHSDTVTLSSQTPPGTQWETPKPELRQRLFISSGAVTAVTASATGDRIATVGSDRVIRIWDTYSGLELISLEPRKEKVVAIEFSPDDRHLMFAESNAKLKVIRLVD